MRASQALEFGIDAMNINEQYAVSKKIAGRFGCVFGSLLVCMSLAWAQPLVAGSRPQVDLSVSVATSPVPFVPGGQGVVILTVHNAGPDAAGTVLPNGDSIVVYEDGFNITTQPASFTLLGPATGCVAIGDTIGPLPDGSIVLVYYFSFAPIAAGETRTCTLDIKFNPSIRKSFATGWKVTTINDEDLDPANDRADYVFRVPSVSAQALSSLGLLLLGLGLILVVLYARKRETV